MKIASSSASFAQMLALGELTQLEWLDLCAAELELDGVVFDVRHFARTDADYLAQLKKTATDLGLTVAALVASDLPENRELPALEIASALGAPLVVVDAPQRSDDPAEWSVFTQSLKPVVTDGKRLDLTVALRNGSATLCASAADCKRLAKDIDSAWLRFATDATTFGALDKVEELAARTVIATHTIGDVEAFAREDDLEARRLIDALRGFRGFVTLDRTSENGRRDVFHCAIGRFRALVARSELSSLA
jgi:sugar phosphate isomerase/epimerase